MKKTNAAKKTNELWSKDYIFLVTANFFLFFAGCLLLPVLPFMLKQDGANDFQIGVVIAVFYVTSLLMRTFTAKASARIGKRVLILLAMTVFTFAMVGYYLFAGLTMIIILRLIQGLGFGVSTTLYGSTVASIVPNKRMGEGMGFFGLGISIAFVLGPCLGAAAVSQPHFKWVFLAAAFLTLVSIVLTRFISADHAEPPVETQTESTNQISDFIEPKVVYESFFVLLVGLMTGAFDTYIVLYAQQMKIQNIYLYFAMTTLSEIAMRLFAGKLYDKRGMNILVVPGAIAGLISCLIASHAVDLPMMCVFAVFYGGSVGVIFPVLEANAMKKVAPARRIAANATFHNFLDVGSALGPLLFGAAAQFFGYSHSFLLSGSIFVVMLAILFFHEICFRRKGQKQS